MSPSVLVSTAHALMEVSAQVLFDDAASMNYFPIADFCVCVLITAEFFKDMAAAFSIAACISNALSKVGGGARRR